MQTLVLTEGPVFFEDWKKSFQALGSGIPNCLVGSLATSLFWHLMFLFPFEIEDLDFGLGFDFLDSNPKLSYEKNSSLESSLASTLLFSSLELSETV